jgi:hypothetical protein
MLDDEMELMLLCLSRIKSSVIISDDEKSE